jgi:DNA-binding beta-propeller fold protein YncE
MHLTKESKYLKQGNNRLIMYKFSHIVNNRYTQLVFFIIFAISLPFVSPSYAFSQAEYTRTQIRYLTSIKEYAEQIPFDHPMDIFVDSYGDIYIADHYKKAVFIFNKEFQPIAKIDKSNGLSARPLSVAVSQEGIIFVAEEGKGKSPGQLLTFNLRCEFQKQLELKGFEGSETFSTQDIYIDRDGNLFLSGGNAGLVVLDKKGRFIRSIKPKEKRTVNIRCVDLNEGNIYCLSSSAGRIYVYDQKGEFIFKFGAPGGTKGKLNRAQGIAIDKKTGLIYIMDYMRHALSVYNQEGKHLFEYGGQGEGPGLFNYPKGIFIDQDGRLFVADTFNKRVQVFNIRELWKG